LLPLFSTEKYVEAAHLIPGKPSINHLLEKNKFSPGCSILVFSKTSWPKKSNWKLQKQSSNFSKMNQTCISLSDGSGSEIFDLGRVNFFCSGWGHPTLVWFWVWKISPKNTKFFNFDPFESKKSLWAWPLFLLRVKSILRLGGVEFWPISNFTP